MQTESLHHEAHGIRFIRDEAATTDEFGSHDRVASAIAQVIDEDHKLKVIGLLGPWGSGKSTVVTLVQQKLNAKDAKKTKSYIFTYDAWKHQNDPPRRAFLDTLVQFLVTQNLTEDDVWREKLDRLNRKIDDTTVTNTPMLTPSGKWILLSLFAVPFGQQLVTRSGFELLFHARGWTTFDGLLCFLGIILSTAPLIAAIGIYIAWRTTWNPLDPFFRSRENWLRHKREHKESSILSVFMNRQITTNRNRVIREPDPTAIEFQNIFREIMEAVAPVNGRHRFIFVIDNLDRLPEADAIAMWGTIRSFFLGAEETKELRKVAVSPTVLLPIDESAVKAIFKDEADQRATSFMDKTFDLSFRITRPLTSHWDTYLARKMAFTFQSNMGHEWPKIASRFYLSYQTQISGTTITPRGINKLVNDIAACWLQWHQENSISFAAIAYYCVFRSSIEANPVAEISNPLAGLNELDPDWAQSIAAIHFGVAPEEAKQILIEQPLRNAIHNDNSASFEELSKIPGFNLVLLRIVEGWRSQGLPVPDEILVTVDLLDQSSFIDLSDLSQIKQILRLAIQSTNTWRTFNTEQSNALASLIPESSESSRNAFLQKIAEIFRSSAAEAAKAEDFHKAFANFWKKASDLGRGIEALPAKIYVPGEARNYFNVKLACQDNDQLQKRFATDAEAEQALRGLANDVKSSIDASLMVQTARMALEVYGESDWTTFVQSLESYVNDEANSTAGISAAIQILGLLRPIQPGALKATLLMSGSGQVTNRLKVAHDHKDGVLAGACLALLLLNEADPVDPSTDVLTASLAEQPDMLKSLSNYLNEFKGDNNIVGFLHGEVARNSSLKGIAQRVFSYRVLHKQIGLLPTNLIIKNLDEYLALLDTNLIETFLEEFTDYTSFWKVMDEEPLAGNVTKIYEILITCGEPIQRLARQKLHGRLGTIDNDAWKKAVRSGVSPYDIVTRFAEVSSSVLDLTTLWTPLHEMTDEVLQSADRNIRDRWFTCASFLNDSGRKTLFHNVGEQITRGASVVNVYEFLDLGGDRFIEESGFTQAADQSVRRIVYPSIESQSGLELLLRRLQFVRRWVEESRNETREQLATLLLEQRLRSGPDLAALFTELLEQLALPSIPSVTEEVASVPSDQSSDETIDPL